jgi:GDP-4-dehydro-6-deoxy-D-mannose reductase
MEAYQNNFTATLNILEAVRQLKLRCRILIAGSAEMYGRVFRKDLPLRENQPLNPVSPYGVSKAICDLLAHQYWLHYGIEVIRVRAFNHIGPRQSLGFVIPDFVSQVAKIQLALQEPVLRVGNLSVKRDFTDVRDVVRGYHLLMQRGKPGDAYHLSSGRAVSLLEVVRLLRKLSRQRFTVFSQGSKKRSQDIPILIGDSSKMRRKTGWRPKIDLSVTLSETLKYWTCLSGGPRMKE